MVGNGISATAHQSEGHMGYLDSLLAALDLLNLGLGQGDPLPNGLQLAPAQLYSLGDPATKKIIGVGAVPQAPTASCTPPASKKANPQSQGLLNKCYLLVRANLGTAQVTSPRIIQPEGSRNGLY